MLCGVGGMSKVFKFTGVVLKEGKVFVGLCLDLDVASQGSSVQEAKSKLLEAVSLYLETAIESNLPVLRPVPMDENPLLTGDRERVVEVFDVKVDLSVSAYV